MSKYFFSFIKSIPFARRCWRFCHKKYRTLVIPRLHRRKYNSTQFQKTFWEEHLSSFVKTPENRDLSKYGYSWGDPEKSDDNLGNYLSIKQILESKINKKTVVLEIGTLGGKWTRYMLGGGEGYLC